MQRSLLLVPFALVGSVLVGQDAKEVETFLKEALTFAKANPKEAFVKEICTPTGKFNVKTTNRLYLTVYDTDGKVVAHGKKVAEVGSAQIDAKDVNGKFYVKARIEAAKKKPTGVWTEEEKKNPKTMQVSTKRTFVGFQNGMVICCGMYEQ
jgi:signal transduction histidine kinase